MFVSSEISLPSFVFFRFSQSFRSFPFISKIFGTIACLSELHQFLDLFSSFLISLLPSHSIHHLKRHVSLCYIVSSFTFHNPLVLSPSLRSLAPISRPLSFFFNFSPPIALYVISKKMSLFVILFLCLADIYFLFFLFSPIFSLYFGLSFWILQAIFLFHYFFRFHNFSSLSFYLSLWILQAIFFLIF